MNRPGAIVLHNRTGHRRERAVIWALGALARSRSEGATCSRSSSCSSAEAGAWCPSPRTRRRSRGSTGRSGCASSSRAPSSRRSAWAVDLDREALRPRARDDRGQAREGRPSSAPPPSSAALFFRDHLPRFLIGLPSETHAGGGIGPEIFNTLYFAVLSTALTLPIGVGAAVYIARFAHARRFVATVRVALDTLASLPSIVYGLFGFLVFVVEMKVGYSLIAGAFVLALVNLPLVVGVAEEAIQAVPRELEDGSLALGATQVQTVLKVTLPYAWPGILSALVLSIGRVFAESAPLIMTAGTTISRSTAYSLDPFRGGETLAVHLWYVNSAGLSPDKAEVSAGTAAVLVILVALTNVAAARLGRLGGNVGKRAARAVR